MGNQVDKTRGGRGQPLGSSTDPTPPKTTKKSPFKKKSKGQPASSQPVTVRHSKEEQRAARAKLVTNKKINVQSELNKKEKMLHIMDSADAVAQGQKAPEAPPSMQYDTNNNNNNATKLSSTSSPKSTTDSANKSSSSLYMADPSSKQAKAAEARIQQKQRNKGKNAEERKNRTRDLLFGDGLKTKEEEYDATKYNEEQQNKQKAANTNKSAQFYKSDKDVPLSSNNKTAEAALARFGQQKGNKVVTKKDRKQRTADLMHGDLLKDEEEIKAAPRQSAYSDDLDPAVVDVHQSIMNLNNCNPHESMPPTAKLLRKVVSNLLRAESVADQEKFGKLRLGNAKIKAAFVDMQYGVETLESLGFEKKKIFNEKEHKMEDYLVFDFANTNHKALIHVMDLLNEYYPE